MRCERCGCRINDGRLKNGGQSACINFMDFESPSKNIWVCERCFLGFLEWLSKGNYIQQKINDEDTKA